MSAPRGNPRQPFRPGGDHGTSPLPQFDKELAVRLTGLVRGTGGESRTTLAPFTGEALADLPLTTVDDVATAFDSARRVQPLWAGTPVRERARVLLRLHDLVLANREEILDLIQWECGKARKHAFEEVAAVALNARYYARRAAALLRPRARAGALPGLTETHEVRRPKGVVGVISPWNYPDRKSTRLNSSH